MQSVAHSSCCSENHATSSAPMNGATIGSNKQVEMGSVVHACCADQNKQDQCPINSQNILYFLAGSGTFSRCSVRYKVSRHQWKPHETVKSGWEPSYHFHNHNKNAYFSRLLQRQFWGIKAPRHTTHSKLTCVKHWVINVIPKTRTDESKQSENPIKHHGKHGEETLLRSKARFTCCQRSEYPKTIWKSENRSRCWRAVSLSKLSTLSWL